MITGNEANPSKMTRSTTRSSNRYLSQFDFHEKSLNFRESMLTGATIRKEITTAVISRVMGDEKIFCSRGGVFLPTSSSGMAPMKIALAGVGNPRKVNFCEVSIVNLARRRAEKTGTRKEA